MKLGLIARCEIARGIAIQSKGFYDHMPVDRVLLVRMPRPDCEEAPDWYPGAQEILYDTYNHQLPEREVRDWLDGLDVVFTVETPNDWRLPDWAREMGVKTVVQGNPEFYKHWHPENWWMTQPDEWWWPTVWRTDALPPGPVMPVPAYDVPDVATDEPHFLHVVGKRAFMDRNGTDVVVNALRGVTERCKVTFQCFGWDKPDVQLEIGSKVEVVIRDYHLPDRWDVYRNQAILVLPRRYGGNCLPAIEAAASGLGLLMPSCSPNHTFGAKLVPAVDHRSIRLACGHVPSADVEHLTLARVLNDLAVNAEERQAMQRAATAAVPRWSEMRDVYLNRLESLL